jgi:alkanesulfonate monooxygenase SsuD/methylene tetrahydromethanopterin reductase-like flavin-dependent oxidoreductase (luciferase family)
MAQTIALGLDTFGDIQAGADGQALSHAQVIRNVIEESVLADEVGVHCIGLGEHHRPDFAISSPEVLLGAIASRTRRIHLASSVTVLSTDDPIRVFQRFSTVNAISSGRAEVILGRGSFTESFPLFGYDLSNYETLFDDKVDLFAALLKNEPVTWRGQTRPPLTNQRIFPPIESGTLKTWIGVGGSPESVVRAAHYDLPLMLAIIGGDPNRFPLMLTSIIAPLHNSADRCARSVCIRTVMSPRPTPKHATSCGRITRKCAIGSAPNAAGRHSRPTNSKPKSNTARFMSARRKRLHGGSPPQPKRSAFHVFT